MRAILFAALLLVDPTTVYAGSSCGGGGGGGSSGGGSSGGGSSGGGSSGGGGGGGDYSSSSSDSSSSSSSSGEHVSHTGCVDDTDVVGYRQCTKFGTWSSNMRLPKMFLEVGSNVRQFASTLGERDGTVTHGTESFSYRVVMPTASDTPSDTAMTSVFRFGFGLPHRLYTGVEGEIGGLVAPASARAEMMSTGNFGSPSIQQGNGLVIGALGLAGIRGATQRGALALEGAAGVRSVRYKFESEYHDCLTTTTVAVSQSVVEARARGELWLGPWLTAGATLGANLINKGEWMAGVYFGVHSRAFAGSR